jgi:sec-independent protein translocase protein TatA
VLFGTCGDVRPLVPVKQVVFESEAAMGSIGPLELIIIGVIAVVLFGAGRLADVGKGLGQGIKEFKKGIKDSDDPPAEKKDEKDKTA